MLIALGTSLRRSEYIILNEEREGESFSSFAPLHQIKGKEKIKARLSVMCPTEKGSFPEKGSAEKSCKGVIYPWLVLAGTGLQMVRKGIKIQGKDNSGIFIKTINLS